MKLTTTTHCTTNSSLVIDGHHGEVEFSLAFAPDGENGIRSKYINYGYVVSYLVHDDSTSPDDNPLSEGDSECGGYNVRELTRRDLERYDEELNDPATMAAATDALTGPTTFIVRVQDHYQIECGILTIGEFGKVVPWTKDTVMIVEFNKKEYSKAVDLGVLAGEMAAGYADWANGCVYGIVVEQFGEDGATMEEPEVVWGFVGDDYATTMLDIYHNDKVDEIGNDAFDRANERAAQ